MRSLFGICAHYLDLWTNVLIIWSYHKCAHYLALRQMCSFFGLKTNVLIIWPYDKCAHYLALRQMCSLFCLLTNALITLLQMCSLFYDKLAHYCFVFITEIRQNTKQ